jgi:hypothetical protein
MLDTVTLLDFFKWMSMFKTVYDALPTPENYGRRAVRHWYPMYRMSDMEIQARSQSDQAYAWHIKAEYVGLGSVWLAPILAMVIMRYGHGMPTMVISLYGIAFVLNAFVFGCLSLPVRNSIVFYGPGHPAHEGEEETGWKQATWSCVVFVFYALIVLWFLRRLPPSLFDNMVKAVKAMPANVTSEVKEATANVRAEFDLKLESIQGNVSQLQADMSVMIMLMRQFQPPGVQQQVMALLPPHHHEE